MYLLDTNVVSELRKVNSGKVDTHFKNWADNVDSDELYISVLTIQELEIGVLLTERRDVKQGAMLRAWLNRYVLPAFEGRIFDIDTEIARSSALLHVPNPRPIHDGLIAATALVHKMAVVTRNVKDFKNTGLDIINPWEK
jgi:toxin FitB